MKIIEDLKFEKKDFTVKKLELAVYENCVFENCNVENVSVLGLEGFLKKYGLIIDQDINAHE